jgi:prepilin-type N-terminal cleavage/methylation domain
MLWDSGEIGMKRDGEVDNEAGFTLIELVFVILILSLLVSIASLTYSGFQTRATTDLAWVDLKVIRAAARTYYMDHQAFPDNINDLRIYLDEIPNDKFAPEDSYGYSKSTAPPYTCTIWSVGPDGHKDIDDGGDDLALTFSP